MPSGKIQTLLFDLDGTLVDSRADLADAVNRTLADAGLPEQAEDEIVLHVGNGMRMLLAEVMGPVPSETLERGIRVFADYYDEHCVDKTVLYPGVRECLSDLRSRAKFAVVTNKPVRFTEKILMRLGIRGMIDTVVGGDSLSERKPHPAPMLKALKDITANPDSALVVGDGHQDVQSGQAAGLRTCVARYGYGYRAGSTDLSPDFWIDRFHDLKEIVI